VVCTHGLFTCNALNRLAQIPQIREIVTTDTVPVRREQRLPKVTVLSARRFSAKRSGAILTPVHRGSVCIRRGPC